MDLEKDGMEYVFSEIHLTSRIIARMFYIFEIFIYYNLFIII